MKKYIPIVYFLLCTYSVFSQKILFEENFDSYLNYKFSNGWVSNPSWKPGIMYLVVGSADTACLCNENPDVISNQRVAGLSDCAKSNLLPFNFQPKPNELLHTPNINLSNNGAVYLRYDSYFKKANYQGIYEDALVQISFNNWQTWGNLQLVPRNKSMSAIETYYIDLSAYAGNPNVSIGFRYIDNNQQIGGWAIDNVQVFEPMPIDLKLLTVTPEDTIKSFCGINSGIIHTYTVQNMGLSTVTSFIVSYRQGGGSIKSDTVTNVSIAPFTTYTYSHKTADTITTLGTYPVTAWVELAGDTVHNNDTLRTTIRGAYFLPKKMVALEEGTGTWHFLSPRGLVYMQQLHNANLNVCQVAVHDLDPMSIEEYTDHLYNLRQVFTPYFLIDRHIIATPDSLIDIVRKEQNDFGFADLKVSSYTYPNKFLLNADVKPAINMTGDFRILVVLTENNVTGTDSGWSQANYYAGGKKGLMGGYENKPDPVPGNEMSYNYVARSITPSPEGKTNLPKLLTANQNYSVPFEVTIDAKWKLNDMYANIFLLRNDDSTILNAARIPFALTVKHYNQPHYINAVLYPNPTNEKTILQFYLSEAAKTSIQLTDISGRTLVLFPETEYAVGKNEIQIPTATLCNGVYIVSLNSQTTRQALKLQVVH